MTPPAEWFVSGLAGFAFGGMLAALQLAIRTRRYVRDLERRLFEQFGLIRTELERALPHKRWKDLKRISAKKAAEKE